MAYAVHLLVCIHGLWGSPDTLAELARVIRARHRSSNNILVSEIEMDLIVPACNAKNGTYDGIDWCAERIADEVETYIKTLQENGIHRITRFSVIGYSLGGLIARYLLGIFYSRGFFDDVKPYNFVTISTPHVGFPRYPGFLSACLRTIGPQLLSRSREQLSLTDQWSSSQRPILEVMADTDGIFFKALSRFPYIHIYANAVNDVLVPYLTGAIELEDPFETDNGLKIDLDEKYEPMIKTITQPAIPLQQSPCPHLFYRGPSMTMKPYLLLFPASAFLKLLVGTLSPILLPLTITYTVMRLYLEARASRARIRELKRRGTTAATLENSVHILEKDVDRTVTALVYASSSITASLEGQGGSQCSSQTYLTSKQRYLVTSLNSLSQMHKHLAFIDGVINSHPIIICRDAKIEIHKRGEGVLRYVAENLVI